MNSKLTAEDIVTIREEFASGKAVEAISRARGIHRTTADKIVYGRSWANAGGPIAQRPVVEQMPGEEWRTMAGFPDYSVSNYGRIRIDVARHNIWEGKEISQSPDRDGYMQCSLQGDSGKVLGRVHRLVCSTFLGPIPHGLEVNHKDGDPSNNRLVNLEVVTKAENIQHSIAVLGSTRTGERNGGAKLTEAEVLTIRERANNGAAYQSIANEFGITSVAASLIATGKTWKHVGGTRQSKRKAGRRPSV